MDALSDALGAMQLSGVIFLRGDFCGEYGVSMPSPNSFHPIVRPRSSEHRLVMFHIVQEGEGYVEVEGFAPQRIREGDLIIVLDDLDHSLVDSPGRPTIDSTELVPVQTGVTLPPTATLGTGNRSIKIVCGMLQFVDRGYNPVFSALPPYLHISKNDGPSSPWLQQNVMHIIAEAGRERPGGAALLARLTELLFVETVRGYLEMLPQSAGGWFAALKDPAVGKALETIHHAPADNWTVADLAKKAGVSRSALSAQFAQMLGISPIAYVTRWRIRLATNMLDDERLSVAQVAGQVGYDAESTFSRAFKREMGASPTQWRNRSTSAGAEPDEHPP